ncbi:MAG TPA: hypothetical protein VN880_05870 [Solirubrobacteraceae bacterium]|nr:hypothetical protein [Solirubrobacteraceae bacterium]
MRHVHLRRPSGAMVVAIVALVVAASSSAVAATKMVNGDNVIIKGTLSGNRLRKQTLTAAQIKPHSLAAAQIRAHTLTGTQINLKKLGKVNSARVADRATAATTATTATAALNANNASNAAELSGQPASTFLTQADRIGTNGLVTASVGGTPTVVRTGPFTITMSCTSGPDVMLFASSSEANSVIDGTLVAPANTQVPVPLQQTVGNVGTNGVVDLEAPSGIQALLIGADGVNSLGTACWANFAGIH